MNWFAPAYLKAARVATRTYRKKIGFEELPLSVPKSRGQRRIWIHAASAGELEMLWGVSQELVGQGAEILVTVFSPSAVKPVKKLADDLRAMTQKKESHEQASEQEMGSSGKLLGVGWSPDEGKWEDGFVRWRPDAFVTAKYEAWPELWVALARKQIPLFVINAIPRNSFKWARRMVAWMGETLPQMTLWTPASRYVNPLKKEFPNSHVEWVSDPRWDRVLERSEKDSKRVQEIFAQWKGLARPWGVLGNAWQEDIEFLKTVLPKLRGTLWVVPHRIGETDLAPLLKIFEELKLSVGFSHQATGRPVQDQPRIVVVNEIGFLAEFYRHADWAFVGGGWGEGLHSVMEPAVYGVPVAGGPKNAEKFPEVQELEATGQLRILRSKTDLAAWISSCEMLKLHHQVEWISDAKNRAGGTRLTVQGLMRTLNAQETTRPSD